MLNILCCVKQVPDVEQLRLDPERGTLLRDGVPSILNPLDANAVSAALKLREQFGGEVTLITMGPPEAESVLRDCLAMGCDHAVLVTGRPLGRADTLATSYTIRTAAAQAGPFDLIFCGKESLDGATGQMGSQLAHRFGATLVTGTVLVREVNEQERFVVAERVADDGMELVRAALPCLFTVEKANYPTRIPNLKGKLAAKKAAITVFTEDSLPELELSRAGAAGSPTQVPRTFPPVLPQPGLRLDNTAELIDRLRSDGWI